MISCVWNYEIFTLHRNIIHGHLHWKIIGIIFMETLFWQSTILWRTWNVEKDIWSKETGLRHYTSYQTMYSFIQRVKCFGRGNILLLKQAFKHWLFLWHWPQKRSQAMGDGTSNGSRRQIVFSRGYNPGCDKPVIGERDMESLQAESHQMACLPQFVWRQKMLELCTWMNFF